MTLRETLDSMIVRVWHNGMRCEQSAEVEDFEVVGCQAFIDKTTCKCVLDLEIRSNE